MQGSKSHQKRKPRLTQVERTARSEEQLMRAALRVIGELGYERATLAAIGEAAGYSRGLVTQRFGSKEGLLGALAEQVIEAWDRENVAPIADRCVGVEALCTTVDVILAKIQSEPDDMRAFNSLLFDPHPLMRARFARLHAELRATVRTMIERGIEAGLIRPDIEASTQATLFVSTLRGALYQWTLDPEAIDLGGVFAALQSQTVRNLTDQPGGRG